jgi:hypothetical protein
MRGGGGEAVPRPRSQRGVELSGGLRDLRGVGKGVPAQVAPPDLLQIQPAGALGDEHLLQARRPGQPGTTRTLVVRGDNKGCR